jgi:hypothetical protein
MREIIPLLAAVIGLTPVILKWINDRSKAAANSKAIQQAKEQVEFWQTWLKAQREVSTDQRYNEIKADVAERLDELRIIGNELASQSEDAVEIEKGPSFFQRILLAYFPHTGKGWILHTLFYVTVSFTAFLIFGTSLPDDNISANPSMKVFM